MKGRAPPPDPLLARAFSRPPLWSTVGPQALGTLGAEGFLRSLFFFRICVGFLGCGVWGVGFRVQGLGFRVGEGFYEVPDLCRVPRVL